MKKILIVVSLFTTAASFGQKASNKISFTKGQKLEVVTNMNISSQSMMGPSSGTITIADTYTVNEAMDNAATLLKVPKQVKLNFSLGSQEMKVDSDNPKDLSSTFGQPIKEIMSIKPEFTVDAAGKVIAVKSDEKKKKEASGAGGMMGMMLPGMDLASAVPQVGNPSFFQILPGREISVGDTWTDSVNLNGNKNVTTYKVKEITDKEILLVYTGTGNTVTTQSAMGMTIEVNAATNATGNITIDKATGIIRQKTSTNNTESTMNLGGREMTSTIKTTAVTNVTIL